MDREEVRNAIRREQNALQQSLLDDAGMPEQTAQWLARLEELDAEHFEDFEWEYLEHIAVKRRARELSLQMEKPPTLSNLAEVVESIGQFQTQTSKATVSDADFLDHQARYHLLREANPDADWGPLISQLDNEMTAEEIVETGLAQKRRVFAMPGPVDEHWNQAQHTAGG